MTNVQDRPFLRMIFKTLLENDLQNYSTNTSCEFKFTLNQLHVALKAVLLWIVYIMIRPNHAAHRHSSMTLTTTTHKKNELEYQCWLGQAFQNSLVALKRTGSLSLSSFTTNTAGKLDVLGHDGNSFGMDGAQIGVFKQTNQVGLACLLQRHDGRALEAQIGLEILGNFSDQPLEGQLADQKLSRLLVTANLSESDGTGAISMGFLDTASGWGTLTSSLRGQLFAGSLATGGFTSSLLGTSHFFRVEVYNLKLKEDVELIYGEWMLKALALSRHWSG
ncbi:hypothetical protein OUZ56_021005 [Daphnia magna]|uniref:Uncharacterized protein n=1 Tax=Daphnia magna TaxID=35525 RepID=A0ABQ9ZG43_9CRUS|nr:hypothetical protein OUZ56_021005 [Daphnia magna]